MKDIFYVFYCYLTDLLKIWVLLWGIMNFTPLKKAKVYFITGVFQFILLVLLGLIYHFNMDMVTIASICSELLTVCFLFEGKYLKKMSYSLLAYTLILFFDTCIIGIGSAINMYPGKESKYYYISRILYKLIIFLPLIIFTWFKRRRKRNYQVRISKGIYALLFIGTGTGMLFITALLVGLNSKISDMGRRTLMVITIIIVITYCLACFMMIIITESRDNYRTLSTISQNVIESQQKYYTLVNEKQQEIHSIRHEMKNHLACINGLYKANKLSEMEAYLEQLIEASNIPSGLFDTGNDIVNAILNDAQSRYRKNDILINLSGRFPDKLYIAPMDLCVIFANIITNAVEAILRIEHKTESEYRIDVKISSFKDDLYIDVINPFAKSVEVSNGHLITSKRDKSIHGFGVKNVEDRVEKYQGSYKFKIELDQFYVEINMKNKP